MTVFRNRQIYLAGLKLTNNESFKNQPNKFGDYI